MSRKISRAKCPYCQTEYREDTQWFGPTAMVDLAFNRIQNAVITCSKCRKRFELSVEMCYYGKKIQQ